MSLRVSMLKQSEQDDDIRIACRNHERVSNDVGDDALARVLLLLDETALENKKKT